jgi:hypothetical protein
VPLDKQKTVRNEKLKQRFVKALKHCGLRRRDAKNYFASDTASQPAKLRVFKKGETGENLVSPTSAGRQLRFRVIYAGCICHCQADFRRVD